MKDLTIAIDTREQRPFTFESVSPRPETAITTLETGDYSLCGYEKKICVERKSLPDLFGSCGKGRPRFENEIVRMAEFDYAAIVAECDWQSILRCPPRRSQLLPKTILASVIAWEQRFGIHFWACPNRAFAEKITYRILERYYRDQTCKPKNIKGNGVDVWQINTGRK
jgi:DNA excision repair protein ERCC-4